MATAQIVVRLSHGCLHVLTIKDKPESCSLEVLVEALRKEGFAVVYAEVVQEKDCR